VFFKVRTMFIMTPKKELAMRQVGWFRRVGGVFAIAMAALVILPPGPVSAAARVRLAAVYYNPVNSGQDPNTNAGRNQEYVVVHNSGTTAARLGGWTLRDLPRPSTPSHVFRFPSFRLRPGASVRVHTGRGSNTATDLYWGRTSYVWGDDSDKATLKNGAGAVVDTCAWTATDRSPKLC
jgi:Lamin Tail Domain